MPECIVCQTSSAAEEMEVALDHDGDEYHACSPDCKHRFIATPEKYTR